MGKTEYEVCDETLKIKLPEELDHNNATDIRKEADYRIYSGKIKNVEITSIPQKGTKAFNSFDVSTYVKQTFGMFGGDTPQEITMRIDNRLIGVIKDRFGEDFLVMRADEARSDIVVSVYPSQQFFGWVFGLGNRVTLISPPNVVEDFKKNISKISKNYK